MRTKLQKQMDPDVHIVGIDFALGSTGVTILRNDKVLCAEEVKAETGIKDGNRLTECIHVNFTRTMDILNLLGTKAPDMTNTQTLVLIENYAYAASGMVCHIAEGASVLKHTLVTEILIPARNIFLVAPQHIKMFSSGKGNVKKEVVIKDVLRRWKFNTDSSDVADSYVLARIGQAMCWVLGRHGRIMEKSHEDIISRVVMSNFFCTKKKKPAPKKKPTPKKKSAPKKTASTEQQKVEQQPEQTPTPAVEKVE